VGEEKGWGYGCGGTTVLMDHGVALVMMVAGRKGKSSEEKQAGEDREVIRGGLIIDDSQSLNCTAYPFVPKNRTAEGKKLGGTSLCGRVLCHKFSEEIYKDLRKEVGQKDLQKRALKRASGDVYLVV